MRRAAFAALGVLAFANAALAQNGVSGSSGTGSPSARMFQPHRPAPVRVAPVAASSAPSLTNDDGKDLRARFGVERAELLACSSDASEQLRGIERGAASAAPEAIQWLAQLAREPARACSAASATGASHAEVRLALAHGLAMHVDDATARSALVFILEPTPSAASDERTREPEAALRFEMARRIAALALAQSGDTARVEKLVQIAREGGPSAAAATAALVAFPPSGTASWAKPLTPRAIRLVARLGDRRAAGALLEVAHGHDIEARAAALEGLGALGDARVLPLALEVKSEDDARLRVAAASALAQLGAPEAAAAVESLLSEDSLLGRVLPLAEIVHGQGVARALAARAASAVDPAVRSAAIVALGRDPGPLGIEALQALASDPSMRAEAMDAIARSPSPVAMRAIEKLAGEASLRRDAVRAYLVRTLARRETSDTMDRVLSALASATDPRDRAAGVFARVTLGRDDAARAMDDRDPSIRRAAYAALLGRSAESEPTRAALLARRTREEDPAARVILGRALTGGDPGGSVSTRELLACARAGGADAPVCALAFAERAGENEASSVEALLASRDPILRVHVALGLARSTEPTRGGRLAAAYPYETDALVRRALVRGLATSPDAPSAAATLAFAARFDPDPATRWAAERVRAKGEPASGPGDRDLTWIRLLDDGGTPPTSPMTGALWPDDGVAVPIAFDADGDALTLVPAAAARLVLAPQLGAAYVRTP